MNHLTFINLYAHRKRSHFSIFYKFCWWCYSSKKKGYFCPCCVGDLCFIRSTQVRCPGQTPDQPFQCPWEPSPWWAAWLKFESCTRSLSCPTHHLISEGEEKINQNICLPFFFHVGICFNDLPSSRPQWRCIAGGCCLALSVPARWSLWGPELSSGCCSSRLYKPRCSCSGRWRSGATPWTKAAAASAELPLHLAAHPCFHSGTEIRFDIITPRSERFLSNVHVGFQFQKKKWTPKYLAHQETCFTSIKPLCTELF